MLLSKPQLFELNFLKNMFLIKLLGIDDGWGHRIILFEHPDNITKKLKDASGTQNILTFY